jgi:hypothetical protein
LYTVGKPHEQRLRQIGHGIILRNSQQRERNFLIGWKAPAEISKFCESVLFCSVGGNALVLIQSQLV